MCVGLHRALIVIIVIRDGTYALNRVLTPVQLREYRPQVVGYLPVADNDALLRLSLKVDMPHLQRVENNTGRLRRDTEGHQPSHEGGNGSHAVTS